MSNDAALQELCSIDLLHKSEKPLPTLPETSEGARFLFHEINVLVLTRLP